MQAVGLDDVAEGVATADIMALKVKATQLVERLRQEKAARLKAERKTQRVAGKVRDADNVVVTGGGGDTAAAAVRHASWNLHSLFVTLLGVEMTGHE